MSDLLHDYGILTVPPDDAVRFTGWIVNRLFAEQEYQIALSSNPGCTVHLISRIKTTYPDNSSWCLSGGGK